MKTDRVKILEVELTLDGNRIYPCSWPDEDGTQKHNESSDVIVVLKSGSNTWYAIPCKKHLSSYFEKDSKWKIMGESVNQRKPSDSKPETEGSNPSSPAISWKPKIVKQISDREWIEERTYGRVHVELYYDPALDMHGVCCE